ncbi:MAG: hypothetical protein ACE5JJ_05055 [Nitrospinota bacterium]
MATLQEQLFTQFAAQALDGLTEEYKKRYGAKKGDRFHIKGITYEIGPPRAKERYIEFEVSSKIPGEELPPKVDNARYFKRIEKLCRAASKKPHRVDMENIVRETRDEARKERDYVKLTYRYTEDELYDNQAILRQVEALARDPKKSPPPPIPGATTLAGRLILQAVHDATFKLAKENVETLIKVNQEVRARFRKQDKAKK